MNKLRDWCLLNILPILNTGMAVMAVFWVALEVRDDWYEAMPRWVIGGCASFTIIWAFLTVRFNILVRVMRKEADRAIDRFLEERDRRERLKRLRGEDDEKN